VCWFVCWTVCRFVGCGLFAWSTTIQLSMPLHRWTPLVGVVPCEE
jgi:hypothetical protein